MFKIIKLLLQVKMYDFNNFKICLNLIISDITMKFHKIINRNYYFKKIKYFFKIAQ